MTDPNDHPEDPGTGDSADAPAALEPASDPRPETAASSDDTALPVPQPALPKGAVVATVPVVARPIPMLAGRRQFARTSPVVVDRGRASFGLPSFGDRRQLGQIGLVVLMVVALGAILLARIGQPESPGLAAVSPSPHASAHATPRPTPSQAASLTSSPSASAPTRTPGASPSTKPATYKVKTGDTLSSIAARFHTTAKAIEDLNNIKSPFVIHPGEILKLP
jgi:LysM repeat protein